MGAVSAWRRESLQSSGRHRPCTKAPDGERLGAMARQASGKRRRRTKDSKLDLIAKVPLFAACSKRDLRKIAAHVEEVDVPEGKVLMHRGRHGSECFVVAEGTAKATMPGRKSIFLGPGSVLGEMSLLDGGLRSATVTAESDMHLLVLGSRDFSAVIEDVPQVARGIMKVLATRLRDAERPQPQH
jgi:CRP/FNR family transcriptional regulator, cyclic AMP receptor protein